jgi:D-sedoheptulose 7-phosphate isomerase
MGASKGEGLLGMIRGYIAGLGDALSRLPEETIREVILALEEARRKGRQVFIFGNGGSAATSSHFASDLSKGALRPDSPPFKAMALTGNIGLLTGLACDSSYEEVFARQLAGLVREGDVVIAISCSGNSPNVLKAVQLARESGAFTIGFTGFDGGRLRGLVDICITVSGVSIEQVEDVHLALAHLITTCLREG